MTTFIILLVALFVLVVALMLLTPCFFKTKSIDGKTKWNFSISILTKSKVISRLIWSVIGYVAIIYCISLLLPIIWMFYTSFKGPVEYTINSFAITKVWEFNNYVKVFSMLNNITEGTRTYGIAEMLFNSAYYAIVGNLVIVFWTGVLAYGLSRFKFVGNKFIYTLGLIIMLVPIVGTGTTGIMFYQKIGLYDKMLISILIPPATAFSGLTFMMIYSAFKAIPHDYSEAARIDGANEYRIMFQIIWPMVLPTLAVFFILGFVQRWNAYDTFLINYPSSPNLAFGMWKFQSTSSAGSGGATIPQILAGFVICMIPSAALYLCSQKLIYSKFTVGGLKG